MTDNNINFTQIKNWWPIITSALIVAGAFFSVKTEIAVQTEKIEQMSQAQKNYLLKSDNSEVKLNNHETRITVLESKKQSTIVIPTQIAQQTTEPTQNQSTRPIEQNIAANEEKSKKPENKVKENIEKNDEDPEPSPLAKIVTPLLNIFGVN